MKLFAALVVAAVAAGAGVAAPLLHRGKHVDAAARIVAAQVRPGRIVLTLRNNALRTVRIAQVLVNDAFVDFSAGRLAVASGRSTQVVIPYAWVEGETYEIGVLTNDGDILEDEIEHAGEA